MDTAGIWPWAVTWATREYRQQPRLTYPTYVSRCKVPPASLSAARARQGL